MKKALTLCLIIFAWLQSGIAQSDNLDPSFGNNGIVRTDIGENYNLGTHVSQVLEHNDESAYFILQVGDPFDSNEYLITKRHSNGSTDSSFGNNGFSGNVKMERARAVIQEDGKIVLAGSITATYGYFDIALTRFNSNGRLDSSFSEDGKQLITFGHGDNGPIILLQYNKKLIVCSGSRIARFNFDGTLDTTFNRGEFSSTPFLILGGAIQSDGKIIVTGNGTIARYNLEGSPDTTFGKDGAQALEPHFEYPNFVDIQDNGKIVVGIDSTSRAPNSDKFLFVFVLVRYNSDGSLDRSFSNDGKVITKFSYIDWQTAEHSIAHQIALQSNGKIVVGGNMGDGINYSFKLARYNVDGSLDKTFGEDGIQKNNFGIAAVSIQKEGKIVVGGSINSCFLIARYTANGSPDNTFGKDGTLTDCIRSGNTAFNNTAVQKDGKIVVTGRTWNGSSFDLVMIRYNIDGTLDNTFGTNGIRKTDVPGVDMAIQDDGKIVVVGSTTASNITSFAIVRYNQDGRVDSSFSGDGMVKTDFGFGVNTANSVAIQIDGKIVVVGSAVDNDFDTDETSFAIARYNTDGSLDNSFSDDGKQTIKFSNQDGGLISHGSSVAITSEGKIAVSGIAGRYPDPYAAIAVFNADGSIDSTFGGGGKSIAFGDAISCSVATQNDGKILLGGWSSYRGDDHDILIRYNSNGSVDFGNGVSPQFNSGIPASSYGNSVCVTSSGKIVLSGFGLSVYNPNGTFDTTFSKDGTQLTPVSERIQLINSIAVAGNRLYAVGNDESPGFVGTIARYLLANDNGTIPPTVSLTAPVNKATYLAPAAHIKLSAEALDKDGTISKVQFYNGSKLLHTETAAPYGFVWRNVPLGNYTLTAKAYDNSRLMTTSAPIHISVVPNKPPVVSIATPKNNQAFAAPGYIHFAADAKDIDGRIIRVEFYNGSTLLRTEYKAPYTYVWKNVPRGEYTITAVATDNWGAQTTSAPVTVKVVLPPATIVSNKPSLIDDKTNTVNALSLTLAPNPSSGIVNIYTTGLQQDKQVSISVLSVSGIVMKTMLSSSTQNIQLDVSSLPAGVYTILVGSHAKVLYKRLVKL